LTADGQREVRTRAADPSSALGHYGPGYGSGEGGDGAPAFSARSALRKSPSVSLPPPPRVPASEKTKSGPAAAVRPAAPPAARPQGETGERRAEEPNAAARGVTASIDSKITDTALEPGRPSPGGSGDQPGRGRPGSREETDFAADAGTVPEAAAASTTDAAPERPGELARDLPAPSRRPAGLKELRALLAAGRWPEPGQVSAAALAREAAPRGAGGGGSAPVTAALEVVRSPFRPEESLARLVVSARDPAAGSRPAANLVLVIDVSRSMAGPNRLPLVREAVGRLLERLQPDDAITLVTYAAVARELLPATPVRRAAAIRAALAGLEAEGLTNGSDGLLLGYACAERQRTDTGVNAVLLCTDGNFNLGLVTPEALAAPVEEHRRRGLRLHVFGFGRTDRNDPRLELLAVHGGGRSGYVNTPEEAGALLVAQVEGLFAPVASEVAVRATFPRELGTTLRAVDPASPATALGEEFPVWDTALLRSGEARGGLYRLTGPRDPAPPPVAVRLAYREAATGVRRAETLAFDGRPVDPARASPEARFALAVTEFARLLQAPPSPQAAQDLEKVSAWARAALGSDAGGYQAEFVALVELATSVSRAGK
jgi:Ca-activated chloride channel family protein